MDTTGLRELVTKDGPFASVYFDDTHNTEDAAKQLELIWRELRGQLAEQGAPDSALDGLDGAVRGSDPAVGVSGRALVATADGVALDRRLNVPPARAVARVSPMPYLVPLAEYGERPPAHVVAVADRVGADVTAVDEHGTVVGSLTADGTEWHIRKVRGGGWSHRNIQSHADELVKQNIEQAAEHVTDLARRTGASLVIVAGESQARKALLEALPQRVRDDALEVEPGGRHEGAGNDDLNALIDELLAEATDERREQAVERFSAALAKPTGLAVQGLEAVTTALREYNVETLLVGEPEDGEVLTGPDPASVAVQEEELRLLGVDEIRRARADEAVVLAATAGNATIFSVGDRAQLDDGFGAILRHD